MRTPIGRDAVIAAIEELQLPQPIISLAKGIPLPAPFDIFLGTPEEFYISPAEEQERLGAPLYLPVWDDGNFDLVTSIHLPSKRFVCFSPEENLEFDNLEKLSYQQALLEPFIHMWEAEFLDEKYIEFANSLNFKFAEEIANTHSKWSVSYEDWLANLMRRAA